MTFEPGGDANIPKQTPVPSPGSSGDGLRRQPTEAARSRVLIRVATINGVLLLAAVLAVYVFELLEPMTGLWLIVGVALLAGLSMMITVLRLQRAGSSGAGPAPGAPTAHREDLGPDAPAVAGAATGTADLRFEIDEVFTITGRGAVATGQVGAGRAEVGQQVAIVRDGATVLRTNISGIEMFGREQQVATAGEQAGLLLPGTSRSDMAAGDMIVDAAGAQ